MTVLTALSSPDDTSITRSSVAEQQSTGRNHATLSLLCVDWADWCTGFTFYWYFTVALHRILLFATGNCQFSPISHFIVWGWQMLPEGCSRHQRRWSIVSLAGCSSSAEETRSPAPARLGHPKVWRKQSSWAGVKGSLPDALTGCQLGRTRRSTSVSPCGHF